MTNSTFRRSLWIVAGPNGVGKTTFAEEQIQEISGANAFVNLDAIARGISPFDPNLDQLRAGRIAIDLMRDAIAKGTSFIIETTLAGKGHKSLIRNARTNGYEVNLLYFYVSDPEEALRRIAQRVASGGHDVPRKDAVRRYSRSLEQFGDYAALCDTWKIFDTDEPSARLRALGKFNAVENEEGVPGAPMPTALEAWLAARRTTKP